MKTVELWDHWLEDLEPEFEGYTVGHPPECFGVYHWEPPCTEWGYGVSLEHPHCLIEAEAINVGLIDRYADTLNYADYPGGYEAIYALVEQHARDQTRMPIYVMVTHGWFESGPDGGEYEWEFSWRPQTQLEISIRGLTQMLKPTRIGPS